MGRFEVGNSGGGRPKGSPNKTTAETKALFQELFEKGMETALQDLQLLEPKDRLEMMVKIAPYIIPKLATVTTETKQNRSITIIHNTAPLPDGD